MDIKIGQEYKRTELHEHFGGQRQSGISTPKEFPYILVFTNKQGEDFGYSDGWIEDDSLFLYTGGGQVGDQEMTSGNKALRDHRDDNKRIFLFEETERSYVRCLAEVNCIDHTSIQTPDKYRKNRKAIQFTFEVIHSTSSGKNKNINHTKPNKRPNKTERTGLVTSRVGQGFYRKELVKKFCGKCAVTGNDLEEILIASHIVPWRDSSDEERLDPDNGILLSPLYDALFDKHIITFSDNGSMEVSEQFTERLNSLDIDTNLKIVVSEGMKKYLARHRDQFRE
tara:strand:- start:679 stop:1524 length:846 start_codon:yes stop_codon:yes gene_type:complete